MRAADALGPAVLPDQLEASRVIDQGRQVHQGWHERAPRLTGGPLLNRSPRLSAPSGRPPRNPTRATIVYRTRRDLMRDRDLAFDRACCGWPGRPPVWLIEDALARAW